MCHSNEDTLELCSFCKDRAQVFPQKILRSTVQIRAVQPQGAFEVLLSDLLSDLLTDLPIH